MCSVTTTGAGLRWARNPAKNAQIGSPTAATSRQSTDFRQLARGGRATADDMTPAPWLEGMEPGNHRHNGDTQNSVGAATKKVATVCRIETADQTPLARGSQ